jgi:predicted nucleotidyltransferase
MITLKEVMNYLKAGKTVELKFHLNGFLFSRHTLTLVDGKIEDESAVDGSTFVSTIKSYKHSFHGRAFKKNAVELSEVITL